MKAIWSRREFLAASGVTLASSLFPLDIAHGLNIVKRSDASGVHRGWLTRKGRALTGFCHENDWWGGLRPDQVPADLRVAKWVKLDIMQHPAVNISRRYPGQDGPGRTEDLDLLTDAMARDGLRGYEHYYGLWRDRRRDVHETLARPPVTDQPTSPWDNPIPPFYELPWARSGEGVAYDGESLYDLYRFNEWYFDRMANFAALCDEKELVFLYGFYNQHNLLETKAHYADFPWNPANTIQPTGLPPMPEERRVMAHAAFYDVTDSERARLHRAYFRHTLDVLGQYESVIFSLGREFTGPASFVRFWLETIGEWERENRHKVLVCIDGTKDVQDEILADPTYASGVAMIDLRGWWYATNGTLMAPESSPELSGRYRSAMRHTTAQQLYRQVAECRMNHPDKAVLHAMAGTDMEKNLALFMGGASLVSGEIFSQLPDSATYETLPFADPIAGFTRFVRMELAEILPTMAPRPDLIREPDNAWCLANSKRGTYLVYASDAERITVNLADHSDAQWSAQWLDPVSGVLMDAELKISTEDAIVTGAPPKSLLWLTLVRT